MLQKPRNQLQLPQTNRKLPRKTSTVRVTETGTFELLSRKFVLPFFSRRNAIIPN